jgi:thiol-disulfide isomerase/thioredoxin
MGNEDMTARRGAKPDRRTVLAGLAGLAAAGPAAAAEPDSPVAHGVLANNPLALAFESARSQLPDVTLVGPNGERDISTLKGRTILMPLWAEWCAPCMSEIPDFARLQEKYGNSSFAIVPILTGSRKQVTPAVAAQLFEFLHASVFEPLIEKHWGNKLLTTMAALHGNQVEIPCNLLIAPDGTVVGREIGAKRSADEDSAIAAAQADANGKSRLIAQAEAGETLSLWGKDAGAEFAAAMASGFLTQN